MGIVATVLVFSLLALAAVAASIWRVQRSADAVLQSLAALRRDQHHALALVRVEARHAESLHRR